MSSETTPADLLDIKMLPAWASEPARPNEYADFQGDDFDSRDRRGPRRDEDRNRRPKSRQAAPRSRDDRDRRGRPERRDAGPRLQRDDRPRRNDDRPPREPMQFPAVDVRFLPHPPAFNSVVSQIKSGTVAYSVFALARLFLEKPERYDVRVTGSSEVPLYQVGENGPIAADRRVLENNAFASSMEEFFTVETTQTEPLKGNFTNVARDRLSGTLLGPTNYHSYQPQLRNLYEQRFSRRMSFADYQKQIEIVSDPAIVEQWKEQARNVTRYTTKNEEPPITFNSAAEAERHFRQHHLPNLIRSATELTIGGVVSRQLPDRGLRRVIEEAWAAETRSPSKMMQELAGGFRQAGLSIFRHRRGMLFVSPIRARHFTHDRTTVSASINALLEKVTATPGILRKKLAEELAPAGAEAEETERAKLTLASDLRWLVSEGYVIEFNDGSLDLPRVKPPAPSSPAAPAANGASTPANAESAAPAPTETAPEPAAEQPPASSAPPAENEIAT